MNQSQARTKSAALAEAITSAAKTGRPAIIAYIMAGYPSRAAFPALLASVAEAADVIEIGVPFSDPMADGVTIQEAAHAALKDGVNLRWILDTLEASNVPTPIVLMSYLNPLMRMGLQALLDRCAKPASPVHGFIIPDLPLEESSPLRTAANAAGLSIVQMVTPLSDEARARAIAESASGFLYAVTRTGITGGQRAVAADVVPYLDRLRAMSTAPVCAGFGIRGREQVDELAGHADGVIVGTALLDEIKAGRDPAALLRSLRV